MPNDKEQLAIMRDVGYGCRDRGRPCLFFTTSTDEFRALQVLEGPAADKVIADSGVWDVLALNGRACWVQMDGYLMRFLRVAKL